MSSAESLTSLVSDGRTELREGYADVGDEATLHYVETGDGPLVVLLHGFPEFWYGWRLQIAPLAAAGFRVVAPDLRGYNLSSKPDGVAATPPASWPPTCAISSANAAPSPRCWSVTTGAELPPGLRR
jgi:pimeloyl-ACP methyl ester carboxylesterase